MERWGRGEERWGEVGRGGEREMYFTRTQLGDDQT